MKPFLLILPLTLTLLVGCDGGPDLAKICSNSPELCNDFIEDNWCKKERVDMIVARNELKRTQKDDQKYHLLIAYEKYAMCMEHASKIEHIKLKHKKTNRIDNTLKAKERIKQLANETRSSLHPDLLFYHWSRYLNERSLAKFLKLEGSKQLENPRSQFNLATYYIKRDPDKTLTLLFHSLELLKENETINKEVFKSITSIFTDRKEYKQGYIWLKILSLYDTEDIDIKEDTLATYSRIHKLDRSFLDKVAETTLDKITAGTFKAPAH